jgi:hypothetical protein
MGDVALGDVAPDAVVAAKEVDARTAYIEQLKAEAAGVWCLGVQRFRRPGRGAARGTEDATRGLGLAAAAALASPSGAQG